MRSVKLILRIVALSFAGLISLLIIGLLLFDHFVQFRRTDSEVLAFFRREHLAGQLHYYSAGDRLIRYVSINRDTLPTIFFIHGSPSSLSIYDSFFSDIHLRDSFHLVAADRPGYGGSGFGRPMPSIANQAAAIWPLLKTQRRRGTPLIIVAGSYGTSVACRLIMDHPDCADGLVLIAPSLGPGLEKVFWFTSIVDNSLVNWAIPRLFRSANAEKLKHFDGLTRMLPLWSRIRVPVFYIQGAQDRLVYTSNADFARSHLSGCPHLDITFLKDRPHFFLYTDRAIIVEKILEAHRYSDRLYLR